MSIRLTGWRCKVWQPGLSSQSPHNGKRKLTPTSCPRTQTWAWHISTKTDIHRHMHTVSNSIVWEYKKYHFLGVSLLSIVCSCVCVKACTYHSNVCVEVRGRLLDVTSFLPPWAVGVELGLPGLLSKCLYPLSHPTHQHYALILNLGEFKETKINVKRDTGKREWNKKKKTIKLFP